MLLWIIGGAAVGLLVALLSHFPLILGLGVIVFVIVVISMMDWSGQGDGREGCNRHTSCNH